MNKKLVCFHLSIITEDVHQWLLEKQRKETFDQIIEFEIKIDDVCYSMTIEELKEKLNK